MDLHELAEERSLAYHARVADLLAAEPARLATARARVAGWISAGRVHTAYATAWRALLDGPFEDLRALLTSRSEQARALRQVTPFAGFLPPRERWAIWRAARARVSA